MPPLAPPQLTLTLAGIAPPWLVLPLAALVMLFIAAHMTLMLALARGHDIKQTAHARTESDNDDDTINDSLPESRLRIRLTNGVVMLVTVPLLAAGLSLIDPNTQGVLFLRVWLASMGLLLITLMLTFIDVGNNARLAAKEAKRLREQTRRELSHQLRLVTDARTDHDDRGDARSDSPHA